MSGVLHFHDQHARPTEGLLVSAHWQNQRARGLVWASCGWEWRPGVLEGHAVTCRACRRTHAWRLERDEALALCTRIRDALISMPTDHAIRRATNLLTRHSPGCLDEALIALDAWQEREAPQRDVDALLKVMAPVHPGWLDVGGAGDDRL